MAALVSVVIRLILFALTGWFWILVCLVPLFGQEQLDQADIAYMYGPNTWQTCLGPKLLASLHLCSSSLFVCLLFIRRFDQRKQWPARGQTDHMPYRSCTSVCWHRLLGRRCCPNEYRPEGKLRRAIVRQTSCAARVCRGTRVGKSSQAECWCQDDVAREKGVATALCVAVDVKIYCRSSR